MKESYRKPGFCFSALFLEVGFGTVKAHHGASPLRHVPKSGKTYSYLRTFPCIRIYGVKSRSVVDELFARIVFIRTIRTVQCRNRRLWLRSFVNNLFTKPPWKSLSRPHTYPIAWFCKRNYQRWKSLSKSQLLIPAREKERKGPQNQKPWVEEG